MFTFKVKLKIIIMLFIIIGLVLGGIGFFLLRGSKKTDDKSLTISSVDETNIKNLRENYESMSNSYGEHSFNLYTKIYGTAFSEKPLTSEFSQKQCVYYTVKVDREYEELISKTDSNNRVTKKWERKNETLLEKEYYADDFSIKHSDGSVKISHHGGEVDTVESYSNFEESKGNHNDGIGFNFAGITINSGPSIKTIGFKKVEKIIPLNSKLFIVGNATDKSGELMIAKPTEKNKPFIISLKSETEILNGLATSSKNKRIGAYVVMVLGVGLLLFGILKKIEVL